MAVLSGGLWAAIPRGTVLGSLAGSAEKTSTECMREGAVGFQEAACRPTLPLPPSVPLSRGLALSGPVFPFLLHGGCTQGPLLRAL